MFIAIWAQDPNGLIGKNGLLPWHLPSDMAFFKKHALHHILVMGRKTYEGLGELSKEYHQIIVMSSDTTLKVGENAKVLHSIQELLEFAKNKDEDIYLAGGGRLFKEMLPYTSIILRTMIDETFEGDAYLEDMDLSDFILTQEIEGPVDEKNLYTHRFQTLRRKNQ
ncbi:MAG: dihydrofolate reductase [Enterococcus sp.]